MRQRPGLALVNVLVFAVFATAFLIASVQFTASSLKAGRKTGANAQAYNVALAGINHAVSWMQRQSTQPVLVFDPAASSSATPDEDSQTKVGEDQLGLVEEFPIDAANNLYGRYEVGRSANAPIRTGVAQAGAHSALHSPDPTWVAKDVALMRGQTNAGTTWQIRSRGYVFKRPNPTDAFSMASPAPTRPRQIVTLEAEVKSTTYAFYDAAVYSYKNSPGGGDEVTFNESGNSTQPRLDASGTPGRAWLSRMDTNEMTGVSELSWTDGGATSGNGSGTNISTSLATHLFKVFGVNSVAEVKNMASTVYTAIAQVPTPLPGMSFVYLDGGGSGNFTFDDGKPLEGGGILFVYGNLNLNCNAKANNWDGLIFVTGNVLLDDTVNIDGAVIVGGNFTMDAGDDKQPKITYSDTTLGNVAAALGTYRLERSTLRTIEGTTSYDF